ncbi:unnamed protein product [Bemisia tabaci]|uniref:Uncharacterized protein n=1 Tax=Bemisia tabaci TaxID=7038 RepID=A0A9P0AF95_BEMTA|nr:unnamed protein product [Bemisia tabaci]
MIAADPEFYGALMDPDQKNMTKIWRGWQLMMRKLKRDGKNLIDCDWTDLRTVIIKDAFYTTYINTELGDPMKSVFCDLWLNLDQPCATLQPTGGTCTPSTSVNMSTAGVTSQKLSDENLESGFLASVLQQNQSTEKDRVICQYISHQEGGAQLKLLTAGEIGYKTAKIEIFPFNQIVMEERMNWWRTAKIRALIDTT